MWAICPRPAIRTRSPIIEGIKMRKRVRDQQGIISLEACIVVPIFMILILFIYSFFVIFTAQNQIAHSLLQSSQSVSLDPFKTDTIGVASGDWPGSLSDFLIELLESNDEYFKSDCKWYGEDKDLNMVDSTINIVTGGFLTPEKEDVTGLSSPMLDEVVRKRFVAYLTGGDETAADEMLRSMHVVNGLEGITFKAVVKDDDIYITATYELEYIFSFQGMAKLPIQNSVCSHLWK